MAYPDLSERLAEASRPLLDFLAVEIETRQRCDREKWVTLPLPRWVHLTMLMYRTGFIDSAEDAYEAANLISGLDSVIRQLRSKRDALYRAQTYIHEHNSDGDLGSVATKMHQVPDEVLSEIFVYAATY